MTPSGRKPGSPRGTRSRRSDSAPPTDAQRPWVRLRSATLHPFIFQRMLADADPDARQGDVVHVYDKTGQLFGRGLYNPRSQITVRMLVHGDTPIDDAFWQERLRVAVELRRALELDESTDAYRLVHGEGDQLSGLIVERYADWLVFEAFSLGMYERWPMLAAHLAELLGAPGTLDRPDKSPAQWQTFVRADEQIERVEGFRVTERQTAPARLIIREHGVRYRVDIASGHKTGFFCDQRDNRRRFATLCRDANVLDLCCYSGGFGLCAQLLGGAKSVTAVDLDEDAVALAIENGNLNQVRLDATHADVFTWLRQMIANGRQYDAVVLDPPKLATSRRDLEDALAKYHDLNALAMQVVRPGGVLLTCSCSGLVDRNTFIDVVYRAGRRAGRMLQMFDLTGAGADHPIMLNCPESSYLKAVWLRVL